MTFLQFLVVDSNTGDAYEAKKDEVGKIVLCGEDISLLARDREDAMNHLFLATQHFPDRKWELVIVTVSQRSVKESRWW